MYRIVVHAVCGCADVCLTLAVVGTVVTGMFSCKKSEGNSRELDIEIHYCPQKPGEPANETIVEMYKVR